MFIQRALRTVRGKTMSLPQTSLLNRSMGFAKIETKWPPEKKVLYVRFVTKDDVNAVPGTIEQMELVRVTAVEWNNYSKLPFQFLNEGDKEVPDVLVNFDSKLDNQSNYGVKSGPRAAVGKWTLNLGKVTKSNILHEFGHALGLYHEHQKPKDFPKMIQISEVKTAEYCAERGVSFPFYWKQLEPLGPDGFEYSFDYDNDSIMRYNIPNEIQDPLLYPDLKKTLVLSDGDKEFVRNLYK